MDTDIKFIKREKKFGIFNTEKHTEIDILSKIKDQNLLILAEDIDRYFYLTKHIGNLVNSGKKVIFFTNHGISLNFILNRDKSINRFDLKDFLLEDKKVIVDDKVIFKGDKIILDADLTVFNFTDNNRQSEYYRNEQRYKKIDSSYYIEKLKFFLKDICLKEKKCTIIFEDLEYLFEELMDINELNTLIENLEKNKNNLIISSYGLYSEKINITNFFDNFFLGHIRQASHSFNNIQSIKKIDKITLKKFGIDDNLNFLKHKKNEGNFYFIFYKKSTDEFINNFHANFKYKSFYPY